MSSIILDSCGLIWLVNGGGKLSRSTLLTIQDADIVYVSAATFIEIGCKTVSGKLKLSMEAEKWYNKALEAHDLVEIPVTGEIGFLSASLPLIHKDPADRLIIATAQLKSLQVVTHDNRFEKYGVSVLK